MESLVYIWILESILLIGWGSWEVKLKNISLSLQETSTKVLVSKATQKSYLLDAKKSYILMPWPWKGPLALQGIKDKSQMRMAWNETISLIPWLFRCFVASLFWLLLAITLWIVPHEVFLMRFFLPLGAIGQTLIIVKLIDIIPFMEICYFLCILSLGKFFLLQKKN